MDTPHTYYLSQLFWAIFRADFLDNREERVPARECKQRSSEMYVCATGTSRRDLSEAVIMYLFVVCAPCPFLFLWRKSSSRKEDLIKFIDDFVCFVAFICGQLFFFFSLHCLCNLCVRL